MLETNCVRERRNWQFMHILGSESCGDTRFTMSPWVPSTAFVHPQFTFRNLPNPQSQVIKWIYSNRFILHLMSAPLPCSSPIFRYLIYILLSRDSNRFKPFPSPPIPGPLFGGFCWLNHLYSSWVWLPDARFLKASLWRAYELGFWGTSIRVFYGLSQKQAEKIPRKQTYPLKVDAWKMKRPFNMVLFQGICSFSCGKASWTSI